MAGGSTPKNLWQAKVKHDIEQEKARNKANERPWSDSTWLAAKKAFAEGRRRPEPRFPIILTDSGPFKTPEDIQQVAGLDYVPEIKQTTKTKFTKDDLNHHIDEATRNSKLTKDGESVRFCDVTHTQLRRIEEYSRGQNILVWFENKKRYAWIARSVRTEQDDSEDDAEAEQGGGDDDGVWARA